MQRFFARKQKEIPTPRAEPLLPATDYISADPPASSPFPFCKLLAAAIFGAAVGGAAVYLTFEQQQPVAPPPSPHVKLEMPLLEVPPAPCDGWEKRCTHGADLAKGQGYGKYWPPAFCADGAKLSCQFREPAWSSASLAEAPTSKSVDAVTDALEADSLFLFLPGTGTPTTRVGSLLSAAADMGHHAIALSYASLPTAVSQMNLWCTRPGANATLCNIELHENVLFGGMQRKSRTRAPILLFSF